MRLVVVQVLLLAIGCAGGGSSSSPTPGKRPNEVPNPSTEAGVVDSSADDLAASTDAAEPADSAPASSSPDATSALPYPRCQVSKYLRSTASCKNTTDRLRTKEGLICAACDDVSFHQPFPCW